MEDNIIENGKKVRIHYTLIVDGDVIDSSRNGGPLQYEQGKGEIVRGLEAALLGAKSGESKKVLVAPQDAFGAVNPKAVIEIPRKNIQTQDIQPGMTIHGKDPMGRSLRGVVTEVGEEKVRVDFNHPLAGKELLFEVEILEIS